jgi:hypothetical protein
MSSNPKTSISFFKALKEIDTLKGSKLYSIFILVWLLPLGSILCVILLFVRFYLQVKNRI